MAVMCPLTRNPKSQIPPQLHPGAISSKRPHQFSAAYLSLFQSLCSSSEFPFSCSGTLNNLSLSTSGTQSRIRTLSQHTSTHCDANAKHEIHIPGTPSKPELKKCTTHCASSTHTLDRLPCQCQLHLRNKETEENSTRHTSNPSYCRKGPTTNIRPSLSPNTRHTNGTYPSVLHDTRTLLIQ